MNILIADTLSDQAVYALESISPQVRFEPDLKAEEIPDKIGDAEILIVRSTKVTKETINAAANLSLIIRAGAGVNTIDLETASSLGIQVANCPGMNSDAVAELAMGLLVALDRHIVEGSIDLKNGVWNKKLYGKASGLKGRTLGIVGYGSIGKSLALKAKGFGMDVVAWSRSLTPESAKEEGIGYCENKLDLAGRADAVSIHLAANAETHHFIDKDFFEAMHENAYFINTSRGETVDTEALQSVALPKGIKVGLDVFENEPAAGANEFPHAELAQEIIGTHHIGASTEQAAEAIASEVVAVVRAYTETGKPLHQVNAQTKSVAPFNLVVRHFNKVGVLAGILDELKAEQVNVEEMDNAIFSGGKAAVCTLKLDKQPSREHLQRMRAMDNIIKLTLK